MHISGLFINLFCLMQLVDILTAILQYNWMLQYNSPILQHQDKKRGGCVFYSHTKSSITSISTLQSHLKQFETNPRSLLLLAISEAEKHKWNPLSKIACSLTD